MHLAGFDLDGVGGGIDASLDGHGLFGLIAQRHTAGDFLIVIASPPLYHHQQVKGAAVFLVV